MCCSTAVVVGGFCAFAAAADAAAGWVSIHECVGVFSAVFAFFFDGAEFVFSAERVLDEFVDEALGGGVDGFWSDGG